MSRRHPWIARIGLVVAISAASTARAERPSEPKDEAPLIVEGVVREVFQSSRKTDVDYLIQIDVTSSSIGKKAPRQGRLVLPAPGEPAYMHLFQRRPDAPEVPSAGGHRTIPAEGATIKAYLYPRPDGGWEGAYPDGFDVTAREAANRRDADPKPPEEVAANGPAKTSLPPHKIGVKVEPFRDGKQEGVRVAQIMPEGPGARAGLEVGDVITEVDGRPTTDTAGLNEAVKRGGSTLSLMVLDKNTGKKVAVKVDLGAADPKPTTDPKPANPAARLGVTVDFDLVEGTSGLKILAVQADSLAQRAGLAKGQVIIEANDRIALNGEQLDEIVKKSGPTLRLKVFDPETRKKSIVEVKLMEPR